MEIEDIKKLTIQPNERLLVRLSDDTTMFQLHNVRKAFEATFPEYVGKNRILIYKGLELQLEKVEIKDEQI